MRIHILGASGSGTSALSRAVAERLGVPALDADDFYWLPSNPPFQVKRPTAARVALLREALTQHASWVLAGSLCGWGDALIGFFDLVVFLQLDSAIRLERLRRREIERFGRDRLQPGGDLHAQHTSFMAWAAQYDRGDLSIRSRELHETWIRHLPARVPVLRLDGQASLPDLAAAVLREAAV